MLCLGVLLTGNQLLYPLAPNHEAHHVFPSKENVNEGGGETGGEGGGGELPTGSKICQRRNRRKNVCKLYLFYFLFLTTA